jgi:hypothetical protein
MSNGEPGKARSCPCRWRSTVTLSCCAEEVVATDVELILYGYRSYASAAPVKSLSRDSEQSKVIGEWYIISRDLRIHATNVCDTPCARSHLTRLMPRIEVVFCDQTKRPRSRLGPWRRVSYPCHRALEGPMPMMRRRQPRPCSRVEQCHGPRETTMADMIYRTEDPHQQSTSPA